VTATPPATERLRNLPPEQLAADSEAAARIVARLTRQRGESKPVRVAAFNSYI
jgi:FXSXX-COOH protein